MGVIARGGGVGTEELAPMGRSLYGGRCDGGRAQGALLRDRGKQGRLLKALAVENRLSHAHCSTLGWFPFFLLQPRRR